MITKITAANADEFYNPRFQEITDALKKAGKNITINSLETYFGNLTDIAALPTKKVIGHDSQNNPIYAAGKYLVVPFDEPYFEIDANTRTITVPEHFKKYGVGVQGDNLAEMLVFKVDRYFDHQDFLEAEVAITWSFTPKGTRTPIMGAPQKGFAQDSELEPGYIVFGFVITREMAEDINKQLSSGTLTFAVSFYKQDSDETYAYSWNTIPVSVTINEGLELKNPSQIKDISRNIIARISNSAYAPSEIAPLIDPYWLTGDVEHDPVEDIDFYLGLPREANFHMDDDGVEDDVLVLSAQAYSDARARMDYTWFAGFDGEDILIAREPDSYSTSTDFTETADDEPVEDKVYYINVEEIVGAAAREAAFEDLNNVILEVVSGEAAMTNDNEPKEAKTYYKHAEGMNNMVKVSDPSTIQALFDNRDELPEYELGTSLDVTGAGSYMVRAQAVKEISQPNVVTPEPEVDDNAFRVTVGVAPKTSILNQSAVTVYQSGDKVLLTARYTGLAAYPSTDPVQSLKGNRKWLPIDIGTNVDDITCLTWDGYSLTQTDIDEAAINELGAGHIIYWADADELKENPRTIVIENTNTGEVINLKVMFVGGPVPQSVAETLLEDDSVSSETVVDGANIIVAKSQTITSNVCVVPAAAVPFVKLNVETTLDDDFDIINEEVADGLTFISNESAPRIIAEVTSTNEQPLGAVAFEAISDDNITDLTYEEIIANTKSEENLNGKYEFEILTNGQKEVNPTGVITEGSYVVRAINRRNHSYAVSAPSDIIRTSFVAPSINAITVKTSEGVDEVKLLDKGKAPIDTNAPYVKVNAGEEYDSDEIYYLKNNDTYVGYTFDASNWEENIQNELLYKAARKEMFIRLNLDYPVRRFTLIDESRNIEGATPTYFMEEVIRTENGYKKQDVRDERDGIVEYEVIDNNGVLEVEINDEGLYRVRVENVYNGTRRIGYTNVFEVLRLV